MNDILEHEPEHASVFNPVVEPYVPAGQFVQLAAPPVEYVPAAHEDGHDFVAPAAPQHPASTLLHELCDVPPVDERYVPARHLFGHELVDFAPP